MAVDEPLAFSVAHRAKDVKSFITHEGYVQIEQARGDRVTCWHRLSGSYVRVWIAINGVKTVDDIGSALEGSISRFRIRRILSEMNKFDLIHFR